MDNADNISDLAYRPPHPSSSATTTTSTTKQRFFGPLLSPTFSGVPNERSAMLATVVPQSQSQPSSATPRFAEVNAAREQFTLAAPLRWRQHDENNNNGHGTTTTTDGGDEQQRLASLARTLANTAGCLAAAVDAERLEHDDDGGCRGGAAMPKPVPSTTASAPGEPKPLARLVINDNTVTVSTAATVMGACPVGHRYSPAGSPFVRESLSHHDNHSMLVLARELSGSIQMEDADEEEDDHFLLGGEQLELQLVDSWHPEHDDQWNAAGAGAEQSRHKDTLERLGNDRHLGLFLAERLAHGLERSERAVARASRQRNSLLDALISALILSEDSGNGGGEQGQDELQLNTLNNKLRRVCRDQQRNANKKNGLLLVDKDDAHVPDGHWCTGQIGRKKSRSMDLLQQQQQQQHGAVQPAATQSNGCILNSEADSHAISLQPISATASLSSSIGTWNKRRRRSCEPGTAYVPLRESECGGDSSGDEAGEEEDVIFL